MDLSIPDITSDDNGKLYVHLKANAESLTDYTSYGTGKVTVTVSALDGSGKKASCVVNVVNPPSSISIAPAKSGSAMAVATGKSIKLKANIGEGYGKVTDKNVKWGMGSDVDKGYATINEKTGELKPTRKLVEEKKFKKVVTVKAMYPGDTNTFGMAEVTIYNWGAISINGDTKVTVSRKNGTSSGSIGVKLSDSAVDYTGRVSMDDFIITTSNPAIGYGEKTKDSSINYGNSGNIAYLPFTYNTTKDVTKLGTAKITISTRDGSKKAVFTMVVTK